MNLKKIFSVFLLVMFFGSVVLADITEADKNLKPPLNPLGKDAVIIEKKVVVDDTYTSSMSKDSYYVKMKIFTRQGVEDYGTVKLTFDPQNENIGDIEATVWTPDGKIHKLKSSDIHKKKVSKEWGDKETEISFVLPGLTEGAVVEYSYFKTRNYLRSISYLYSQSEVPTMKASFTFIPWPEKKWGYTGLNIHQRPQIKQERIRRHKAVTIVLTDIPALPREEYSLPYSALREQVIYYYTYVRANPAYYWTETGEFFFKHSGRKFLKANRAIKSKLKEMGLNGKSDEDIMKTIYNYVITHHKPIYMLTRDEYEKLDEKYIKKLYKADIKVKKIVKLPYLTPLQMNLLTACYIKNALPNAKISLGFYVPWDKGVFIKTMKTFKQFDEYLLKVENNGKVYYIDAGSGFLPFGFVPYGARHTEILFVNEDGAKFEKIKDAPYDQVVTKYNYSIEVGDEKIKVKTREEYNPYAGLYIRSYALFFNKEEFNDFLTKMLKKVYGDDLKLISYKVENLKNPTKPLILETEFEYPYEFEELGDNLLFKLVLEPNYSENPFAAEKRYSPIVFKYPSKMVGEITCKFPEDIVIDSLPENADVDLLGFFYKTNFTKVDDNTLKVKVEEGNKHSMFSKNAHWQFRNLFAKLIKASNPKVVLKETE